MLEVQDIANWLWSMRGHMGPKLATGRRGIGKSNQLTAFANRLLADGLPRRKLLLLDGESSLTYRLLSCEKTMDYITAHSSRTDETYVLIREGSAFPDLATTLGILAASPRFNVSVTASSRHMLTAGLGNYLNGALAHCECLPPSSDSPSLDFRRIWHEALLYDVHAPVRQPFNMQILNSLACHLSDNVGEPLSLRSISSAISPSGIQLSPHTIDNYLTALCDAYLITKCLRYDLAEECVLKSQFRCFFTSSALRTTLFGTAPSDEPRRARLNTAWLQLRRQADEVFIAASAPESVDFVTRTGTCLRLWHAGEQGVEEISRDSFAAC